MPTIPYTGAATTYIVPEGVTEIQIIAVGGGGGGGRDSPSNGGRGGMVTSNLTVTAGTILDINIGGGGKYNDSDDSGLGGYNGGGDGSYGGGGGGMTTILKNGIKQIIAGGGGGGGQFGAGGNGGGNGISSGANGVGFDTTAGHGGSNGEGGGGGSYVVGYGFNGSNYSDDGAGGGGSGGGGGAGYGGGGGAAGGDDGSAAGGGGGGSFSIDPAATFSTSLIPSDLTGGANGSVTIIYIFEYSGAPTTFQVPPGGLAELQVIAVGGGGGGTGTGGVSNSYGGSGGMVTSNLFVSSGTILSINIGGGGEYNSSTGGYNGGGSGEGIAYGSGGGMTTIKINPITQIVAGGGGGGAATYNGGDGGGNGTSRGANGYGVDGGQGGFNGNGGDGGGNGGMNGSSYTMGGAGGAGDAGGRFSYNGGGGAGYGGGGGGYGGSGGGGGSFSIDPNATFSTYAIPPQLNGANGYVTINILSFSNVPISNICFPAGTPIRTDQGLIAIDCLDPLLHTIHKKPIIGITQTITMDKYLVCFEKDALALNTPSKKTIMSKEHKLYYKGNMFEADAFVEKFPKVKRITYTGEILYNVLMKDYETMDVNHLRCETLQPNNVIAKLYHSNLRDDVKNTLIVMLNTSILKKDSLTYNKIASRLV